jgi:glutathione S-transferase
MAVKLHRCGTMWLKIDAHPCWRVQKALDEAGIAYEVVKHPAFPRSKRRQLQELTGQDKLPVIELEDGTVLREESKDLAARVRAGGLTATD